eukprot:5312154-Prymnesium_polylepis.1
MQPSAEVHVRDEGVGGTKLRQHIQHPTSPGGAGAPAPPDALAASRSRARLQAVHVSSTRLAHSKVPRSGAWPRAGCRAAPHATAARRTPNPTPRPATRNRQSASCGRARHSRVACVAGRRGALPSPLLPSPPLPSPARAAATQK